MSEAKYDVQEIAEDASVLLRQFIVNCDYDETVESLLRTLARGKWAEEANMMLSSFAGHPADQDTQDSLANVLARYPQ